MVVLETEVKSIKEQINSAKKEEDPSKKNTKITDIYDTVVIKKKTIDKKIEDLKNDGADKNNEEIKKLEAMSDELASYQLELENIQSADPSPEAEAES
jgi:hypothetical protein